jgi:hypothetical protein
MIKRTLQIFICLFVRFYLLLKLQFFSSLIPWKHYVHLYCMRQILVFNAIHTIVTDMEGIIMYLFYSLAIIYMHSLI